MTSERLLAVPVVCSPAKPCLYNVQADPTETTNLATNASFKATLDAMAAKLASYVPYVDGNLLERERERELICITGAGTWMAT